jgi:hypothetical protein
MKKVKFIRAEGRVWVPNYGSWLGNWARHIWLERYFLKGSLSIACKETWERLVDEYEVEEVIENDDGDPIERSL